MTERQIEHFLHSFETIAQQLELQTRHLETIARAANDTADRDPDTIPRAIVQLARTLPRH